MSQNTVRKYVAELENKHLITTEPTKVYTRTGIVRNGNLLYTILPIQQAIDYFHEQQILKVNEEFLKAKAKNSLNNTAKSHSKTAV